MTWALGAVVWAKPAFLSAFADSAYSYPGGRTQIRFQPGAVFSGGISVFETDSGYDMAYLMPSQSWHVQCAFDPGENPAVPNPLFVENRTIEVEARTTGGVLINSWTTTQAWPRIGTPGLGIDATYVFGSQWVIRCFVTFGSITLGPATMKIHPGSDLFPSTT